MNKIYEVFDTLSTAGMNRLLVRKPLPKETVARETGQVALGNHEEPAGAENMDSLEIPALETEEQDTEQ